MAAGAITMLGVSSAQITPFFRLPIEPCLVANTSTITLKTNSGSAFPNFSCQSSFLFNEKHLLASLEPQGVLFEKPNTQTTLDYELIMKFPKTKPITLTVPAAYEIQFPNGKFERIERTKGYFSGWRLLNTFKKGNAPFTMSGWINPMIRYAGIRFSIGTKDQIVKGETWYPYVLIDRLNEYSRGYSDAVFPDSASGISDYFQSANTTVFREYKHLIQTNLPAGEVVVVLSKESARQLKTSEETRAIPANIRTYIAQVEKDGSLEYPSSAKTLRFAEAISDLQTTEINATSNVLVLKFTHDLNREQETFAVIPSSKLSK
jgi:hypothetical protein